MKPSRYLNLKRTGAIIDEIVIAPRMKVKDLPETMKPAFSPFPGGYPDVAFEGGRFWAIEWSDEYTKCEKTALADGDLIVVGPDWGVYGVKALELAE